MCERKVIIGSVIAAVVVILLPVVIYLIADASGGEKVNIPRTLVTTYFPDQVN